jgi:hypothetical protein
VLLLTILPLSVNASAQSKDKDYVLHTFKKIQLTNEYWSEGASFGDIDGDGQMDAVVPPFWYSGPDFKTRHSFYPADHTFTVTKDGTTKTVPGFDGGVLSDGKSVFADTFLAAVIDLNGDGWPDIIVGAFGNLKNGNLPVPAVPRTLAYWYENPGKEGLKAGVNWKQHILTDEVSSESLQLVDLFNDGHPVLLGMHEHRVGYFRPDPQDPYRPWIFYPVSGTSDEFEWYNHGLGYGDITNSGHNDIVYNDGWWKQPEKLDSASMWRFSPYPFNLGPNEVKLNSYNPSFKMSYNVDVDDDGVADMTGISTYGGSQMVVYDVNGDGLPDIVTGIDGHKYGLVWWEQLKDRDARGNIRFKRHMIIWKKPSDNKYGIYITQMQALLMADMDGDGIKDIITGKHFWGHGSGKAGGMVDPDSNAPADLYWFKLVRNGDGTPDFIPYLIDNDSGTGNQFMVGDLNGDGLPDIVVGNKRGAFVFLHEVKHVSKEEWEKAQPPVLYPDAKQ